MAEKELLQNYKTELRRGSLTLAVLANLQKPYYGYALLEQMEKEKLEIEANTLYPLLRRLEKQGLLTSDWDTSASRPRKYYQISEYGREIYQELLAEWLQLQRNLGNIFKEGDL